MKKQKKKIKRKILLLSLFFALIGGILIQNITSTSIHIYQKIKEKKEFSIKIKKLKEEEEQLKGTVTKLQDPDYVARYAREKYLFSKDGEIIIRIPE